MGREVFENELNEIRQQLLVLSREAVEAVRESVQVLKDRDPERGKSLIENDEKINYHTYEVEEACLNVIATQQPVAGDLRLLFSVLQISNELERIADYAKGIARINEKIGDEALIKPLVDVPRMAEITTTMLEEAIRAFLEEDEQAAREIPGRDVEVDMLYNQIHRELLTYVMSSPIVMEQAMMLIWVAHNLERVGDRVVNICERVIFTLTGDVVDLD
jgi:phosphate transport system protein